MSSVSRTLALSVAMLSALACGEPSPSDGAAPGTTPASTPDAMPPTPTSDAVSTLAGAPRAPDVCVRAPMAEGAPIAVRGADSAWVVLALESLEALVPRDSARMAARLARLGGSLSTDTSVADFRGLPIAVRSGWRVVPSEGDTVLAAILVRRIPIESDPMEEIFTVLASPEARPGLRDGLLPEWVQRDVGREETVAFRELVALWRLPADTLSALLAHDDERGVVGQFLVRTSRTWSTRWIGVLPDCDTTAPR